MNIETIGSYAGVVWNALNAQDAPVALKQLKKVTKLKDKELYLALGWLARENKVAFSESEADSKEYLVSLI